MTDEDILELAKSCGFDSFNGEKDDGTQSDYWECWEEQLLKFARELCDKSKWEGYYDGYEECSIEMGGENLV